MNIEQVIAQLESLREHCMSKVHDDEPESVWLSDVLALNEALTELKRIMVKHFCDRYLKCEDCPLNEKDVRCSYFPWADMNELNVIIAALKEAE